MTGEVGVKQSTHGIGIKTTVRHPKRVLPHAIPSLLNIGVATSGIPAPNKLA